MLVTVALSFHQNFNMSVTTATSYTLETLKPHYSYVIYSWNTKTISALKQHLTMSSLLPPASLLVCLVKFISGKSRDTTRTEDRKGVSCIMFVDDLLTMEW